MLYLIRGIFPRWMHIIRPVGIERRGGIVAFGAPGEENPSHAARCAERRRKQRIQSLRYESTYILSSTRVWLRAH